MKIKYIVSFLTISRIIGAFALLLTQPLSIHFFTIYALCCVSDILDGHIARKTKTTSKFGEVLDSLADMIFIAIVLIIFIPLLSWERWIVYWISMIALIRFLSLGVGFMKYCTLSFLHTYINKITGLALACFPILFQIFGITTTALLLCVLATLSALEELIIICHAKELNRNIKGIFFKNDTKSQGIKPTR